MIGFVVATSLAASLVGGEINVVRVVDFTADAEPWSSIDDVVMGGVSDSEMVVEEGTAVFRGELSLERGGGFCSVRSRPAAHDLSRYAALVVRVRGDGHRYKLRLRTSAAFDGVSYEASFTPPAGTWQEIELPLSSFRPVFRGRSVPGAPPLDPARVVTFGLLISDRQAGPFRLEIAWIGGRLAGDVSDV
jgi:monofunctional biosynthetic peptidoglycan transglycosylase